jgi:hypothetical protein
MNSVQNNSHVYSFLITRNHIREIGLPWLLDNLYAVPENGDWTF